MDTALSIEKFIGWTSYSTCSLDGACGVFTYIPELVLLVAKLGGTVTPLGFLEQSWDEYPSAKRYNLYQRFVYSIVLVEIYDIEDLFKNRGIVYYVLKGIYVTFWKVALLLVPQIKQLQKDKRKHTFALLMLKFIGEEICISNSINVEQLYDVIHAAVLNGTLEVIELLTRICPQLVWDQNKYYSLVRHSILHRSEKAYKFFMHQRSPYKYFHIEFSDHDRNNLLHLAGKPAPIGSLNMVTGAALQMQRDLQWFEEVSNFVRPCERTEKNFKQETPFMVFKKEHKALREKGEKWVKKIACSYTITAFFIFATVLVAAITVPSGKSGDRGKAVYERRWNFIIFAVSDVMSLITSATSLLLFRSFDTEQYAHEDFLYSLPKKIIIGLIMLFISVATMLIAFSATLCIMFMLEASWILILIAAITCLPIALFVALQLPLLVKLIFSTYGRGFLGKLRGLQQHQVTTLGKFMRD